MVSWLKQWIISFLTLLVLSSTGMMVGVAAAYPSGEREILPGVHSYFRSKSWSPQPCRGALAIAATTDN